MKRRSPQEKKQLSYERDRKNIYGENDKASRKNIPRAKRNATQACRKQTNQLVEQMTEGETEDLETRVAATRHKCTGLRTAWRKIPDVPLGDWLRRRKR